MGIPEEQLVRDQAPVKGIGGVPVSVEGKVKLAFTLGKAPRTRTHYVVFLVVKLPLSYNAILGRPTLFDFEAVTSIRYLALKFPTEAGVGVVRGSQKEARAVYLATVAELSSAAERLDSEVLEVRDEEKETRTEPVGELETFPLSEAETDKDVQRLTGRVVALNRFMSRSAEKCLPFFKMLRKVPNFEWTKDCRKAFEELKSYLSSPHVLSNPLEGEKFLIYLAASEQAISAVLVRVDEGEQKQVFYVSKVLKGAETRYLNIEKVAYALLLAVRKFRVYLKSHQGIVMMDQPLKKILRRPETSGQMLAWSMEISPYCLEYRPWTSIKSQALADFIAECSFNEEQGESTFKALGSEREEEPLQEFEWKLYVDGASSAGGSGAGMMLKGPGEFKVCYALRLEFKASNNVAEYETLINGILVAMEVGVTDLEVNSDSQLVINQVTGVYQARDPTMQDYLAKVKAIEAELKGQRTIVKYQRIPREENEEADLLSRLSKEELEQLPDEVEQDQNWMTPYLEYLEKGKLPEDKDEARRIAAIAANYQAVRGTLYRRGKSSPWLRCVSPEEAIKVMEEIHRGICGAHEGAGTLANKIFRQGYY
ncbi:uncharacterized protein LOC110604832 [Manihot esculenta]|uniref:uncharacterized protein LOC110604832 n=1 Tax=Manihot esculenta TaxID=3983 RepID=UPI001CC33BC2|nr:uncharacterized protein LOC110604832 [Manihot esculenta]